MLYVGLLHHAIHDCDLDPDVPARPATCSRQARQAAKVEPVIYEGVRFTAPNDDGRRGYVQAWDTKTNKMLWEVTVYRNRINPLMEEDVQWVFIKKLSVVDGKLIVVDERDRAYSVDTKTHPVKRLKNPPKDGTWANKPAAGNAGIASQLAIGHHRPGVPEPERSAMI